MSFFGDEAVDRTYSDVKATRSAVGPVDRLVDARLPYRINVAVSGAKRYGRNRPRNAGGNDGSACAAASNAGRFGVGAARTGRRSQALPKAPGQRADETLESLHTVRRVAPISGEHLAEARWSWRKRRRHTNPRARPGSMTGRKSELRSTTHLPTRIECAFGLLAITSLTLVNWRMRR